MTFGRRAFAGLAKIVDINAYRAKALAQRSFENWSRRFNESYSEATRPGDLSGRTLFYLAQPGEDSNTAFYEFILGVLDLGGAASFYYLDKGQQLQVVDILLFLADQIRFEMMRRIGWVRSYPCQSETLIDLVVAHSKIKAAVSENPPQLAETYPDFDAFRSLTAREQESFIRRLLPKALDVFKTRL